MPFAIFEQKYNALTDEQKSVIFILINSFSELNEKSSENPAISAMKKLSENAKQNETSNMTLEEINAEIEDVRNAHFEAIKKQSPIVLR